MTPMELLLVVALTLAALAGSVLGTGARRHVQTIFTACRSPRGRLWIVCVALFVYAAMVRTALDKPAVIVCEQTSPPGIRGH